LNAWNLQPHEPGTISRWHIATGNFSRILTSTLNSFYGTKIDVTPNDQ